MIERFRGEYTPVCDYCEKRLPGADSFADALRAMRQAGWESRRQMGGEPWLCVCDDCIFEEKMYGVVV